MNLGLIKGKNMFTRDRNTGQVLLGSAWTELHEKGSLSHYETLQRLLGKGAHKYLLIKVRKDK